MAVVANIPHLAGRQGRSVHPQPAGPPL